MTKESRHNQQRQRIAYKLYTNRIRSSRSGNQDDDWKQAGELQRNPVRLALLYLNSSLISVEKQWVEPCDRYLQNASIFNILNLLSSLGLILAVASFIAGQDQRHEQEVFTAWQTITSAAGQSGSGGRREALEFLHSRPLRFPWFCRTWSAYSDLSCLFRQPRQRLAGLDVGVDFDEGDLGGEGAFLAEVRLPGADLFGANLEGANLLGANLERAFLLGANLERAYLLGANLERAFLRSANLERANLLGANLERAFLLGANLERAFLVGANLEGAYLGSAIYNDRTTWPDGFTPPPEAINCDTNPDHENCTRWNP